ncbi:hypothetical protein CROQUDRAFT_619403 [Cronartium quercuum f. sp. fusiforme G11]|uniref:Uncharacterized protein n=1 Tax=Cronartium quercuum f. sp. fusiforme G11 TaxID=708437 RepID=A0A9P6T9V5_9BASI|nr:hypothetical protein CROQUDRAFT_619403 [Cronartium quercuum f. sp. fusiforme G11]
MGVSPLGETCISLSILKKVPNARFKFLPQALLQALIVLKNHQLQSCSHQFFVLIFSCFYPDFYVLPSSLFIVCALFLKTSVRFVNYSSWSCLVLVAFNTFKSYYIHPSLSILILCSS